MRQLLPILVLVLAVPLPSTSGDGLFGQAVEKVLNEKFPHPKLSYLLLDSGTGNLLAQRWDRPDVPVPAGSLIKPFTALAYLRSHEEAAPRFTCRGKVDGCWYPPGHGRLDLTGAVAHSCNAYFADLALRLEPSEVISVAEEFHLRGLSPKVTKETMVGMGTGWAARPVELARAYGEFVRQTGKQVQPILAGLSLSASQGTGRAVGETIGSGSVMVKTGTAPCVHGSDWANDGYVMVLYPRQPLRYILLVRVHGSSGAQAGITAGKMLATVLEAE